MSLKGKYTALEKYKGVAFYVLLTFFVLIFLKDFQ
jgi:hypothetical protein